MNNFALLSLAISGLGSLFAADAETATITWLGGFRSVATAVSADGSVVVGSFINHNKAFRWTNETGMIRLGDLPGGASLSQAYDVSADGRIVVGRSDREPNESKYAWEAFRWTDETGMVGLGQLSGHRGEAKAISDDGNVIVGSSELEAFRWTAETGMVGLGRGRANAVSPDGRIVAGGNYDTSQAFRWTAETGMVDLAGATEEYRYGVAYGMSSDGSVIVGGADRGLGLEPFRWTAETGMVTLGSLGEVSHGDGQKYNGWATAVSAGGDIVVGHSQTDRGSEAFIWDTDNGMRNLRQVLIDDFGLDLTGWTTSSTARGISADGTVIVGDAITGGAWIVVIPEPSSLLLALLGMVGLLHRWR